MHGQSQQLLKRCPFRELVIFAGELLLAGGKMRRSRFELHGNPETGRGLLANFNLYSVLQPPDRSEGSMDQTHTTNT